MAPVALCSLSYLLNPGDMQALYTAVQKLVDAAGAAGVQVLCLQEAWTMPFAFCTREREWLEFAEPETGPSTKMLQKYAQKYHMVIINSILERDEPHGETIWNTAVVIGHMGNVIGKHRKVKHCNAPVASYFAFCILYFKWQQAHFLPRTYLLLAKTVKVTVCS